VHSDRAARGRRHRAAASAPRVELDNDGLAVAAGSAAGAGAGGAAAAPGEEYPLEWYSKRELAKSVEVRAHSHLSLRETTPSYLTV
jgi:hypothetical protein